MTETQNSKMLKEIMARGYIMTRAEVRPGTIRMGARKGETEITVEAATDDAAVAALYAKIMAA